MIIGCNLYRVPPVLIEHLVKINQEAKLHPGEVLKQDLSNYSNQSNVSHYSKTWSFPIEILCNYLNIA